MQNFISKYGLLVILIVVFLSFMNGCGANVKLAKMQADQDTLKSQISLLKQQTLTSDQMINIINTNRDKPIKITINKK